MSSVNEAVERLKTHTLQSGHNGEGNPHWLPLAEEIRDKIEILMAQLYKEVPLEVRRHHRAEALSQGTNWEMTAFAHGKNRGAFRMSWVDEAFGMIKAIILDSEDEKLAKLGPRPRPTLARRRTPEEDAEREGLGLNELRKQMQCRTHTKIQRKEGL